jgi:2-methylisocitrate lyase-like PEP mutase family enzyme
MNAPSTQPAAVPRFRALHESGCFIMPNPWDAGSARFLAHLGFPAVATTSAGFAFTQALPDAPDAVPRELMLTHIRDVVRATTVPVNADFLSGYGESPEGVAESVALCVATGVAGLSIEDSTGDAATPLYERDVALDRLRAARAAIDAGGSGVLLTARCEAWLVGHPDARRIALERLVDFADAGADCLYAPAVRRLEDIEELVRAVSPKPLNVLVSSPSPGLTLERLRDAGVRRISVGGALARVAWGAVARAATSILQTGTFEALVDSMPFAELQALFGKQH